MSIIVLMFIGWACYIWRKPIFEKVKKIYTDLNCDVQELNEIKLRHLKAQLKREIMDELLGMTPSMADPTQKRTPRKKKENQNGTTRQRKTNP